MRILSDQRAGRWQIIPAAVAARALVGSAENSPAAVVNLLVGAADGVVREYDLATGSSEGNFVSGLGNVIGLATLIGGVYVGSYAKPNVHRFAYPIAGAGSVVVNSTSDMGQPAGTVACQPRSARIRSFRFLLYQGSKLNRVLFTGEVIPFGEHANHH